MIVTFDEGTPEYTPECIADVIAIEIITTGTNIHPDIIQWITDYWDYVRYVEHGNECSYSELVDNGLVNYIVGFLTGAYSLDEVPEYEYLTDCFNNEGYDSPAFGLIGRALTMIHEHAKTL